MLSEALIVAIKVFELGQCLRSGEIMLQSFRTSWIHKAVISASKSIIPEYVPRVCPCFSIVRTWLEQAWCWPMNFLYFWLCFLLSLGALGAERFVFFLNFSGVMPECFRCICFHPPNKLVPRHLMLVVFVHLCECIIDFNECGRVSAKERINSDKLLPVDRVATI